MPRGSLSCLQGVLVDVAQPTMLELRNKVVSTHPGILVTPAEVAFGEVPGYGSRTTPCRWDVHIAYHLPWRRFHFGL